MKKFKLQSGHIIKVDDSDAFLLRAHVYRGHTLGNGHTVIQKGSASVPARDSFLSHAIAGEAGKPYVLHLNGDDMDFRRANLRAATVKEWHAHTRSFLRDREVA